MGISKTLRDIAEESKLEHSEKVSLRRIAKECEKLEAEKELLREAVGEALALVKAEWKVRDNHPASNWAKEVEYFEQALKEK